MNDKRPRFWKVLASFVVVTLALVSVFAVSPAVAQTNAEEEVDEQEAAMHYSLYYENFKNESYESAISDLRWILENAPGFPRNDDRNFERAVEAYEGLAEAAEDEETRRAYLDSALVMIEQAVPTMEEIGAEVDRYEWELRKGRFIQSHSDVYLPEMQDEMMNAYREAYERAPDRINPYYLDRIIRAYLEEDDREGAIAFMDELEERRGDDEEVAEMLNEWRDRIFTNPDERIAYLEERLEKDPEDSEAASELFELYRREGMREEASQMADRVLEANPSPSLYRTVAKMRLEDNEPEEAFELYEQSLELDDEEPSAEVYYNMGLAQQQMNNLSQARNYFREAIETNEEFGQAYIAIGDLYASAVSECSAGELGRRDRAVYWLAVDYYQRARNADSSIGSTADSKINTYRQYWPTSEDIFYTEDWEPGGTVQIDYGCYSWINESTTVRNP